MIRLDLSIGELRQVTPRIRALSRILPRHLAHTSRDLHCYLYGVRGWLLQPARTFVYLICSLRNGVQPARCAHALHAPHPTLTRPIKSACPRWLHIIASPAAGVLCRNSSLAVVGRSSKA